ncbi:hypothetical protein [Yersinia mollaretii]|nr:hypothetical protein [Yersinia mollaretii]
MKREEMQIGVKYFAGISPFPEDGVCYKPIIVPFMIIEVDSKSKQDSVYIRYLTDNVDFEINMVSNSDDDKGRYRWIGLGALECWHLTEVCITDSKHYPECIHMIS